MIAIALVRVLRLYTLQLVLRIAWKMSLKLYYDLLSQPSRAVYIALKFSKFNFESKKIEILKGQHMSEEYAKVNRFKKVPAIDHNGFCLSESVAIMRYLVGKKIITDSLYPQDSKKQAQVDEFMEWQHICLRVPCLWYFRAKFLDPILGKDRSPQELEALKKDMLGALKVFENKWLGNGNAFVNGDTPTLSDLLAACELEQGKAIGFDASEQFKVIAAWLGRVRQAFNPIYDEAHVPLNKLAETTRKAQEKA